MRTRSMTILFGIVFVATTHSSANAAEKGQTCDLSDAITLSARPNGKGRKRAVKAGATAKVLRVTNKGMIRIKAGKAIGWINGSTFDLACGAREPEPDANAENSAQDDNAIAPAEFMSDEPVAFGADILAEEPKEGALDPPASALDTAASERSDSVETNDSSIADSAVSETQTESPEVSRSNPSFDDASDRKTADEKPTFIALGIGGSYSTQIDSGLRGDLLLNLGTLVDGLRLNLNFIYYPDASGGEEALDVTAFGLNLDTQLRIASFDSVELYALAGFGIVNLSTTIPATAFSAEVSSSTGENQLNAGLGLDWDGLGFAKLFIEGKYALLLADESDDQIVISLGLRFDII